MMRLKLIRVSEKVLDTNILFMLLIVNIALFLLTQLLRIYKNVRNVTEQNSNCN